MLLFQFNDALSTLTLNACVTKIIAALFYMLVLIGQWMGRWWMWQTAVSHT